MKGGELLGLVVASERFSCSTRRKKPSSQAEVTTATTPLSSDFRTCLVCVIIFKSRNFSGLGFLL